MARVLARRIAGAGGIVRTSCGQLGGFPVLSRTSFQRSFCSYEASVASKLTDALGASNCVVEDRSGGCGQSFSILIESEKFRGLSKLKCQRMVQEVIREEIAQWHAVSIQTKVPE
ncbi:unnamed protein product [Cladocopium goreaui]|uniref:Altered inheritance of mitochondria protein 1 n=1 Tax=Cladocopium goreaui TaxID=2562237 RepID=A0A9P1G623_9DINO|nr:unnamed protein product [Cladocopium goreaui]|mmetsp:Transcript_38359/g.82755  ORF Transcript_38359/g.82755 Transcript_38359/m.82755 type:complete len:115 (-) Transcript_38359:47-391(-)